MSVPTPIRRSQAEYAERDLAILHHLWRYRIGLNALLSKKFFIGKQAGHVMPRFAAKGWLQLESGKIPGGVSYAMLTASGGREIGREIKPKPLSAVSLDLAISVGTFCVFDAAKSNRRFRLLPQELAKLGNHFAQNVPHVWTDEFDTPAVLRVQLAATGTPREVRRKVSELIDKTLASKDATAWLRSQQFGLAILGHTPERVAQLRRAFENDSRFSDYRIVVGLGATSETLAQVLRKRRRAK